jgi:ATP-dependent DNA helicase RecG
VFDVILTDGTGKVHCKYFRLPYKGYFERFEPNQTVRVIGKVTLYRDQIEFHHPDIQDDDATDDPDQNQIIPIYPESEGITNRQIRKIVDVALTDLKKSLSVHSASSLLPQKSYSSSSKGAQQDDTLIEKMPSWLNEKYDLVDRFVALETLHRPPSDAGIEFVEQRSRFHRRIIFEEFFWLELFLAAKKAGVSREKGVPLERKTQLIERLKASLPFSLTRAQLRALDEVVGDLAMPHPMHRLIQGDVGSGKTLVALASALVAIENGYQAAIMVPTEILAEQHERSARKLLEPLGLTVGLLTGSMRNSEREQTYQMLKTGAIQLVVGTHALIQDEVEFHKLGLVIIDEQHRFGVHQRNELKKKGLAPHFLVMTATPIPRTLAMTVYGDLDVSVIDELPPGRSPITTRVVFESKRQQVMSFLKEQIAKGRQSYFVYPLVEESEKIDLKDAHTAYEQLCVELPESRIGLLHGKMKPQEKDEVMSRFRNHEIDVLVSTTVIEVGVDVPNANLMIVEHAERFGLSQLHQLRGRVGRGQHKSFCVLMLGRAVSDESRARTEIMEKTSDGFKIAEADLEIRGPGEFLGSRQSGLPGFKMANLVRDIKILQDARQAAFEVLSRDSLLRLAEHRWLRNELLKTHGVTALASVG